MILSKRYLISTSCKNQTVLVKLQKMLWGFFTYLWNMMELVICSDTSAWRSDWPEHNPPRWSNLKVSSEPIEWAGLQQWWWMTTTVHCNPLWFQYKKALKINMRGIMQDFHCFIKSKHNLNIILHTIKQKLIL